MLNNETYEKIREILENENKFGIEQKTALSHMDNFVTTSEKIEMGRKKYLYKYIKNNDGKNIKFK